MTVTYLTEYNTRCFGVAFEKNGCIKIQNFKDISDHENKIFCVKPLEKLLGKSESCVMTAMSGSFDKSVFDANNILVEISEENDNHRYFYIGGDMICSFLTNDKIYKYISNMGNNLRPYSIAIGKENIYFLTARFNFIKREKINEKELLKSIENSVDPFEYDVLNCGKNSFKRL